MMESGNQIDWAKYWGKDSINNNCRKKSFLSFGELSVNQRTEAERLSWARTSFSELIVNFPINARTADNPLGKQKNINYSNDGRRINLCFGPTNEPEYWIGVEIIKNDIFLVTDINGRSILKPQQEVPSTILTIIEEVSYWGE